MAAPTLIASVQIDATWAQVSNITGGASTKNYASTLSTAADDLIVALQGAADSGPAQQLTTSDGANTYTQRTSIFNAAHCSLNIATATDTAGGTRTITLTRSDASSGDNNVGGAAFQFRGHGGVGNVLTPSDGVQTGNLTCSANSAILVLCLDWGATTGVRTWSTINDNAPTS